MIIFFRQIAWKSLSEYNNWGEPEWCMSPTLAWLHCACVCIYAWTDHLPEILKISAFKYFTTTEYTCRHVLQLSPLWERAWRATARLQGRCERESESEDNSSWMHWQHAWQLTFWTMVRVWWSRDKAGCEWQSALASGAHLAWPLIHSRDSPASSWFECEA